MLAVVVLPECCASENGLNMSIKKACLWLLLAVGLLCVFFVLYQRPKWITRNGSYQELYLLSESFPKNAVDETFRLSVSQLATGLIGREQEVEVAAYKGEKALSIAKSLRESYEGESFNPSERKDLNANIRNHIYILFTYQNVWGISRLERINESEARFFADSNSSSYRIIEIKKLPIDISSYLGTP
jgi:hypothetical protein